MMFSDKQLKQLIIPLLVEQILAVTVGLADSVMIAGVGEAAVSGRIFGGYGNGASDQCVFSTGNWRRGGIRTVFRAETLS